MAKQFWEQDKPAAAEDFWSADKLAAQADLPAGVTPSAAGAGRGVVNRPLSLADALPASQQVYDPVSGAPIGETDAVDPGNGAAMNDEKRSQYQGRVLDSGIPGATPASVGQDIAAGILQIGPTAVKGVGDLTRLATGDRLGKGITDFAERGNKAIREVVGSERAGLQRQRFEQDMRDPALNAADVIVGNPGALADMALPTVGSMAIPLAAAGVATKLATGTKAAQLAAAIDPATVAARANTAREAAVIGSTVAQNAGDTYGTVRDAGGDQGQSYLAAAITAPATYLAGRLTDGGAEGQAAKALSGQRVRGNYGTIAGAMFKEGGQEVGEQIGQSVGETVGAGAEFDANKISKEVAVAGTLGAVMGGGVQAMSARVKKLRDAGEDEAAKLLESRMTAASVKSEISAMGDAAAHPAFQDAYRTQRTQGLKPAEAAARAGIVTGFGELASTAGLNEKAVKAASDAAAKMPLDKVPGFLEKFVASLTAKGMGQALPPGTVDQTLSAVRDDAMTAAMDSIYADTPAATMDAITALENERNQPITQSQQAQPAIQNVAEGDQNVSPSPAVSNVVADASGSGSNSTPVSMESGAGNGNTGVPAMDAGDVRAEPAGVVVPSGDRRDYAAVTTIRDFPSATTSNASEVAQNIQKTSSGDVGKIFGQLKSGDMSAVLFEKAFEALKSGKSTISGVKDPILTRAKSAFDQGLIKTPEDIRNFEANGYPQPNVQNPPPPTPGQQASAPAETAPSQTVDAGAVATAGQDAAGAQAGGAAVQTAGLILGRDNTPLTEGGKAFKTKKAADEARKLQPMMRVIRAEGGYALAEKTPAQLAAQEKAARRLRNPQTSPPGQPIPAHAMIAAEGGLSGAERADMGMEGNVTIGNRKLFAGAGKGLSIEQATERLIEDGYLQEGASHNDARALIKRSLNQPQYTPEGVERMAEAEKQAQFDAAMVEVEAVAEVEALSDNQFDSLDDLDIPDFDAPSNVSTEDAMRAMGFTDQEIQDATANQPGIESRDSQGSSGIAEAAQGQAQEGNGSGALQAQNDSAGRDQDSPQPVKPKGFDTTQRADGTLAVKGDTAAIRETLKDIPAKSIITTPSGVLVGKTQADKALAILQPDDLTAPTKQDILDQQERNAAAEKTNASQRKAEQERLRREAERKDIAKASEAAASTFELGGDAEQNLSGQQGMFDAPAAPAKPATKQPSAAELRARADLNNALADLGDIFSKPFKAYITPEQEQKLLPVLTRVLDAAFRLGYSKFKDAAKFALDQIKGALGADVADALTLDHLQGAYIAMAGGKPGVDTKRAVIDVENKADIENHTAKTDNQRTEESNVPSTNGRVERNSAESATQPALGDIIQDDARGTAAGTGNAGGQASRGDGRGRQNGDGLPAGSTAVDGERSDQLVRGGEESPGPASSDARTDFGERSGDSGITGIPPDAIPASEVKAASTNGDADVAQRSKQRAASSLSVKPGDLQNVRDTLPYLLPAQQEDVYKAETVFARPNGYGMLFTNGTGTGKTFTGLGIVKRFAMQGKDNTLIVVPDNKIASDWIKSGKALGLDITQLEDTTKAGKGIVLTTYANLGANDSLAKRQWDLVIPDESHSLMQAADGVVTSALQNLRAITHHQGGALQRYTMQNRPDIDRFAELDREIVANNKIISKDDTMDVMRQSLQAANEKLEKELAPLRIKLQKARDAVNAEVSSMQGAKRTRLAFLSATPFAYEKTVDWASGYLFDYMDGYPYDPQRAGLNYNQPDPFQYFMMTRFGYTMRTNKLNQPGPKVDSGLMQRQFNAELKKKGVLSGRMLDVKPDYDRRFVLVNSSIGNTIDEALEWLTEQAREESKTQINNKSDTESPNGMNTLASAIKGQFDYLSRRYLLEAIKAQEVVPIVKQHLALGRKVVVFHDYNKGGSSNPFDVRESRVNPDSPEQEAAKGAAFNQAVRTFRAKFPGLVTGLNDLLSPIEVFKKELPQTMLINGKEKAKDLLERYLSFQDDANGPQVMLVQSDKNKGWSGHDTTGKHQRVLINLGQPTAPTKAIQQEGRIYRTGQASNAIMRYLNTGTSWERWAFATTIATRSSTAENLGMGEQARALKDSFVAAFEESDTFAPGHAGEGTGGKARDKASNAVITEYDRARSFYFATAKKNSKTKAQEGVDYFATPEPVGLKMVQWLDARPGEDLLEPSGGHGAIARWMPEKAQKTVIEPSANLRSRMALVLDMESTKMLDGTFEELNVVNKFDGIAMNPPFGTGGKTAIDHLAKAATHLRDGGRIVALIPTGPAADKKFDKWMYEKEERRTKPLGKVFVGGVETSIYKGDTVTSRASWAPEGVVTGWNNGSVMLRVEGMAKGTTTSASAESIKTVQPTGKRTEEFSPAANLYMVADIKLPQVTFERAGTAVATRIVVIEKHANESEALKQAALRMDFSGIDNINELFDRLENVALPDRPKAKQVEEVEEPAKPARKPPAPKTSAPPKAAAQIGDTVQIMGKDYTVSTYTTNAGKELRGVWVPTRAIALFHGPSTFEKKGKGFFVRERDFPKPSTADAPKFSRSQSQSEGISRADFNAAVAEAFGAKVAQRLLDNKVVIPLEDQTQLPDHVVPFLRDGDIVYGFHDKRTNATYAVLSNLQPEQIKGLVLHEVGVHYGFKNMLGQEKYDQVMKRLEVMRKMGSKAVRTAYANAVENSSKPEHVAEETLAYMMNSTPELGIVQEVIAKIKAFLFRTFGIGGSKLEYADLVMLARAAVRHSSIGKDGGSGVPLFSRSTDQTQTEAFKRWFGDSKVVTPDGAPLVVYHGTRNKFTSFDKTKEGDFDYGGEASGGLFFTSDAKYAEYYGAGKGGTVMPVYLSIQNPARIPVNLPLDEQAKRLKQAQSDGYDGALIGGKEFVAFEPEQVKSATGNNGDFNPDNPDIRFSRAIPTPGPSLFQPTIWNTPDPTRTDKIIYELQDGKIDLKRVQQAIEKSGQTIKEEFDARLAETLYPGRVAYRSQTFLETEVKPLLDAMARNNVGMDELADYLHARGAEERNKQIAKVNPAMPDGGAGTNTKGELMTTQAARDYLANISQLRKMVLDAMAKRVDAITTGTRNLLVTEGLEKQETIDAWEAAYKNYVPMFRDEAESAMPPHPQGSGFTIKGSSSKRATGSTKEVTNILAHVLMQREAAITRGEKNRVALALYGQALSHPNPDFWTTIRPNMTSAQIGTELQGMGVDPMTAEIGMKGVPTIRTVDPVTNKVVDRPNPMYKNLTGAIPLKVNGEDRVLMLNTKMVRGQRLAESLKNLDGLTQLDLAGNIVGKSTRWLAAVNTQYNPAFGLVNLTRDTLGGVINLGSTDLRGNALKVLAQTPTAIIGIARELASNGQNGTWQKLYRQFQADGGQTGFKENFRDPHERAKAIEKELAALGRAKWSPGSMAHGVLDLLDGFNTTLENAVRLSAYKAALDKGMSRAEAARLGRELTVDFNRKGRAGREVGPLYAFFNASVQGSARTIEALKGPTGRKIIMGGLGLGVLQALMLAFAGYDDDEIPEFVKTRSLVIPLNLTGKGEKEHILIPYPLGLHVIPNTGRVLAELTLNGGKDIAKRTFSAIGEVAGAFNPLGGGNVFTSDGLLKTAAPTLIDPLIEMNANKNFAGNHIEKESYGGEADNRPGVARTKEATARTATGQAYMSISKAINAMTGGTDYEAGLFSPTPEMARYVAQTVGGGVLREIEKTINASVAKANGQDVKSSQIPVLGRFYGEVDDDRVQTSRYYETAKKIRQAESSIKAASTAGDFDAADKIAAAHPEIEVQALFKKVQKNLSALNKEAVQVINDPKEMKLIDQDRVELMRLLNLELADLEKASGDAPLKDKVRALNPLAN